MAKKFLFVWDCDFTISNEHTMFWPAKEIFGEEVMNECKRLDKILYSKGHEYFLDLVKEKKIPKEKVLEAIDSIPLSPDIKEAFEVIKANREKCVSIILTSNLQMLSEEIINHMGYKDLIDAYIGIRKVETTDSEKAKVYPGDIDNSCDNCKPNPCKVNTYKNYIEHNGLDYSNFTKIFLCDGGNDLCYAKTLSEGDYVLARTGFGLMKRLDREKNRDVIKASLKNWANGKELGQLIKEIISK